MNSGAWWLMNTSPHKLCVEYEFSCSPLVGYVSFRKSNYHQHSVPSTNHNMHVTEHPKFQQETSSFKLFWDDKELCGTAKINRWRETTNTTWFRFETTSICTSFHGEILPKLFLQKIPMFHSCSVIFPFKILTFKGRSQKSLVIITSESKWWPLGLLSPKHRGNLGFCHGLCNEVGGILGDPGKDGEKNRKRVS